MFKIKKLELCISESLSRLSEVVAPSYGVPIETSTPLGNKVFLKLCQFYFKCLEFHNDFRSVRKRCFGVKNLSDTSEL